ncbi:probable endonuclease 4 isoform X2 [Penaeus chinensis]|uniref:probable endonuclease 4 isoform X1 n=1 Tax=Penaeus chinensis TaxID=139456 RepID=UPI001FB854AC|nr:probable endonuclease 4 isoform X1 [Penaeus chinensis]XP_047493891.1 probable endonuclease 4 isoform X2 [Penaeus chinensis]
MMSRSKTKAKESPEKGENNVGKEKAAKKERSAQKKRKPSNKNDEEDTEQLELKEEQEPKRKRGKREVPKEKSTDSGVKVEKKAQVAETDDAKQESEESDNEKAKSKTASKVNNKGNSKFTKNTGKVKKRVVKEEETEETVDNKVKFEKKGKTTGAAPKLHRKKKTTKDEAVPRPVKYESLGEGPAPVPSTGIKYMGCHVSGAGGVWLAFQNAVECNAKSFALFLCNQRQWVSKPLDELTVTKWKDAAKDTPPHLILPHGSYLMNLGSPNPELLEKSRNRLLEELQRCERLGIPHYNFHPGSTTGKISREECCKRIAESINIAHEQTKGVICVLENMSCQGFTVGGDLHELRVIIENVKDKSRVGVCIDTCHTHAAGYDLSSKSGFETFVDDFEKIIGWQFLRGLHINDSKGKFGDHQDRHENIGKGTIGIEGFRRIMNCSYFNDMPLILETPWTSNEGYAKEIKILEGLVEA